MPKSMREGRMAVRFEVGEREVWVVRAVEVYRAMAAMWPGPEDVVWELGAATGAATVLAAKRAREVCAVEKAPEKLEKLRTATAEYDNVHVIEADATADVPQDRRADLLLIDVGGDAPPWRTMELAERWAEALQCERIVVRNTRLWMAMRTVEEMESVEASRPLTLSESGERQRAGGLSREEDEGDAVVLQRVVEGTSGEAIGRLVGSLRNSGYRERRRLSKGLARVGTGALAPLAELIEDRDAPIEARRSAAETMGTIAREAKETVASALEAASMPVRWALTGRTGQEEDGEGLLTQLGDEDELIRFIARRQLRKGGAGIARSVAQGLAGGNLAMAHIIAGLDGLSTCGRATAQEVAEWAIEAAGEEREAARRRLGCAALGSADQKWSEDLLEALEAVCEEPSPIPYLRALRAAAHSSARQEALRRLVGEALDAGVPAGELKAAANASPHPSVRRLAEVVGRE